MGKRGLVKCISLSLVFMVFFSLLFVQQGSAANSIELLPDPGFEEGVSHLTPQGTTLEVTKSVVHSGKQALKVSGRKDWFNSFKMDITDTIEENGPGKYLISGWEKLDKGEDQMVVVIWTIATESGEKFFPTNYQAVTSKEWVKDSKVVDLTWEGELLYAGFGVGTNFSNGDLYIDDISLTKTGDSTATATPKTAPTATPKGTAVTPKQTATPSGQKTPVTTVTPKATIAGSAATPVPTEAAEPVSGESAGTPTGAASTSDTTPGVTASPTDDTVNATNTPEGTEAASNSSTSTNEQTDSQDTAVKGSVSPVVPIVIIAGVIILGILAFVWFRKRKV